LAIFTNFVESTQEKVHQKINRIRRTSDALQRGCSPLNYHTYRAAVCIWSRIKFWRCT